MLKLSYTKNTNEKHSPRSLLLLAEHTLYVPSGKQVI